MAAVAQIIDLVSKMQRDKMVGAESPIPSGKTPIDVMVFPRRKEFDLATTDADLIQWRKARFSDYADAMIYAGAAAANPEVELVLVRG